MDLYVTRNHCLFCDGDFYFHAIHFYVFMYLLYTKKSTNPYSLVFSIMNMVSSSLWITYSRMMLDTPLLVRGSSDLVLFSISTLYILSNRFHMNRIYPDPLQVT